jgi:beta-lactamase regulating signal transducer with metallopeptidase domain
VDVLLNWLMQGAIVAIAAAAGLRVISPARAQARYGFIWAAYLLVLALPAVQAGLAAVATAVPSVDLAPAAAGRIVVRGVWWTSPAFASGVWITWSIVHAVRLAAGAVAVRQARREGQEIPRDVLAGLPHWSDVRATGRPARVVLSDRVRFAAVLGCGSPVIALAPSLIAQLSAADLDRVLVHEWAHVQRRDDVAQVLQRLVRAIVGWHPAAWWLERQLELEREVACDEVAVRVTGSAKCYAACLTTLAGLPPARLRLLPVLGAISPSPLGRRLMRILSFGSVPAARPWRAAAICGGMGLAALAAVVSSVRVVPSTAQDTAPTIAVAAPAVQRVAAGALSVSRQRGAKTPHAHATGSRRRDSIEAVQSVARAPGRSRDGRTQPTAEGSSKPIGPSELLPSSASRIGTEALAPLAPSTAGVTVSADAPLTAVDTSRAADTVRTPWAAAADAGAAIGRTSQSAGVATAGFFSRFGKTIARSY